MLQLLGAWGGYPQYRSGRLPSPRSHRRTVLSAEPVVIPRRAVTYSTQVTGAEWQITVASRSPSFRRPHARGPVVAARQHGIAHDPHGPAAPQQEEQRTQPARRTSRQGSPHGQRNRTAQRRRRPQSKSAASSTNKNDSRHRLLLQNRYFRFQIWVFCTSICSATSGSMKTMVAYERCAGAGAGHYRIQLVCPSFPGTAPSWSPSLPARKSQT